MKAFGYFIVGSLLLYSIWYFGLGYWVISPSERQDSRHFWTQETEMKDMAREKPASSNLETEGPVRFISYKRLVFGVLSASLILLAVCRLPFRAEVTSVMLLPLTLGTPFFVVWLTYMELPVRYIPLLWGLFIGLTTWLIFAAAARPWRTDPVEVVVRLLGKNAGSVIAGFLIALVAGVTTTMVTAGYTKPVNWFAWCIVIMTFGTIWTIFGLLLVGLLGSPPSDDRGRRID